jgi:hypothetical protein
MIIIRRIIGLSVDVLAFGVMLVFVSESFGFSLYVNALVPFFLHLILVGAFFSFIFIDGRTIGAHFAGVKLDFVEADFSKRVLLKRYFFIIIFCGLVLFQDLLFAFENILASTERDSIYEAYLNYKKFPLIFVTIELCLILDEAYFWISGRSLRGKMSRTKIVNEFSSSGGARRGQAKKS